MLLQPIQQNKNTIKTHLLSIHSLLHQKQKGQTIQYIDTVYKQNNLKPVGVSRHVDPITRNADTDIHHILQSICMVVSLCEGSDSIQILNLQDYIELNNQK